MAPPMGSRYNTLLNVRFQTRHAYTEPEALRGDQYHHASELRTHGMLIPVAPLPGN
jgi:hypothetical protein